MGIFNDALDDIPVKWETKNLGENKNNAVLVEWIEDHSDWKSLVQSHVKAFATEQRDMPFELLRVKEDKSGDNPQGKWNPKFPHSKLQSHEKEIWGVIRAEYFFLKLKKDKPWNKIAAKMGRTGMDSLWEHPDGRIAICESKASMDQGKFENYKARKVNAFDCLGRIQDPTFTQTKKEMTEFVDAIIADDASKKECATLLNELMDWQGANNPECITTAVIQMNRRWLSMKVFEMLKAPGAQPNDAVAKRAAVRDSGLKVLQSAMRKSMERWFNFYGRDPFYRLPGKYKITGATSAEFVLPKKDADTIAEKEWGFPDKVEKSEFIHLDEFEAWNRLEDENERARTQEILSKSGGGSV